MSKHQPKETTPPGQVPEVYRTLVERTPLPMAQVEGEGHVVRSVNPAFCRLLGKSADELIGKPFADLLPPGHECLTMLDEVYRTGQAGSHVKQRDDVPDPVYWSYTCLPVRGAAPQPLGVVVQVTESPAFNLDTLEINQALLIGAVRQHELTERAEQLNDELRIEVAKHERAEQLLRRSRDIFLDLVEKAPFGLYVVDAGFRLYQASSGSQGVFGNIRPLIGRDLGEVLGLIWPKAFANGIISHFRHTLATGEPYVAPTLTEQRSDTREVKSYDWRIERITLPEGELGVVCYFYDITDRKKAQDLLQEADKRKSEFLATLAHELRNPLAPLRNGLDLLAMAKDDPATWDQAHGMMKRQLEQMVRLIDELLDLSRITHGTVELQRVRMDLRAVLDQAVETSHSLIDQREHTLTVDLPDQPLIVEGDGMRLVQVFNNLLNNAAKYTDRGGTITVRAEVGNGEVSIAVTDNGIGIAREDLGRVFDMFAQVAGAGKSAQGGLGIGLNIVKHLTEMHGGRIEVRSDGLGKGSCFTVRLPSCTSPGTDAVPEAPAGAAASPARRRILIVDDNEDAVTMMALLLGKWGHEVHVAHDGEEALATGALTLPEIVLMDIGMPVMDGHTACGHMRRTPWGKRVFIVALTGWGQEEDKRKSEQAGFDHHLVKPVGNVDLKAVLAMATGDGGDGR